MSETSFQITEDEAGKIYDVGIWADHNGQGKLIFIRNLKDHNLIKKSPLEEAKENWKFDINNDRPKSDIIGSSNIFIIGLEKRIKELEEESNGNS